MKETFEEKLFELEEMHQQESALREAVDAQEEQFSSLLADIADLEKLMLGEEAAPAVMADSEKQKELTAVEQAVKASGIKMIELVEGKKLLVWQLNLLKVNAHANSLISRVQRAKRIFLTRSIMR